MSANGYVEFTEDLEPALVSKAAKAKEAKHLKKQAKKKKSGGFQGMDLDVGVFKGVMSFGFKVPTPIQRRAIPELLAGHDIVAMARTGSGKTGAFVIPLLNKLATTPQIMQNTRAIILSPTRELAMQTHRVMKQMGRLVKFTCTHVVGGNNMDRQFEQLARRPDVLIATPGRMAHTIAEMKLNLKTVDLLIFDEADRLFEAGFQPQIMDVLKAVSANRQTALFSATMPTALAEFTKAGLNNPTVIRLDGEHKLSEKLRQQYFNIRTHEKDSALLFMFNHVIKKKDMTIVFCCTRYHVDFVSELLDVCGIPNTYIYGSLDPAARKINIAKFHKKKVKVLVVTDVAARGIDIPQLDNVIHYDFPAKPKLFVHRSGRVARAGRHGTSYALVTTNELPYMVDLMLFLGIKMKNVVPEGKTYNPDEVYCGTLPSEVLDDYEEVVNREVKGSMLEAALRKAKNAYKMYFKTRSGASSASAARAKELERAGISLHPHFIEEFSSSVANAARGGNGILSKLRDFMGGETIFEGRGKSNEQQKSIMEAKRAKDDKYMEMLAEERRLADIKAFEVDDNPFDDPTAELDNDSDNDSDEEAPVAAAASSSSSSSSSSTVTMTNKKKKKKKGYDKNQSKGKTKTKKQAATSSTADPSGFYMSREKKDTVEERGYSTIDFSRKGQAEVNVDSLVMDLGFDDQEGYVERRKVKKWDAKKRRYTFIDPGAKGDWMNQKGRMNEAGVIIKGDGRSQVGDRFAAWKATSKAGHRGLGAARGLANNDGPSMHPGSAGNKRKRADAGLKESSQIAKNRKLRAQTARRESGKRGNYHSMAPAVGRHTKPHQLMHPNKINRRNTNARQAAKHGNRGGKSKKK